MKSIGSVEREVVGGGARAEGAGTRARVVAAGWREEVVEEQEDIDAERVGGLRGGREEEEGTTGGVGPSRSRRFWNGAGAVKGLETPLGKEGFFVGDSGRVWDGLTGEDVVEG